MILQKLKTLLSKIDKFNLWLAVKITSTVSSMWCAWAFLFLALTSLPEAIQGGISTLISWVAQTMLQLVLLSIIMVDSKIQSIKVELRAEQDHTAIQEELQIIKDLINEMHVMHKDVTGILGIYKNED